MFLAGIIYFATEKSLTVLTFRSFTLANDVKLLRLFYKMLCSKFTYILQKNNYWKQPEINFDNEGIVIIFDRLRV